MGQIKCVIIPPTLNFRRQYAAYALGIADDEIARRFAFLKDATLWTDFGYFACLAREGSLLKASEVLGVSQATLSRWMRALEAQMGARLFQHGAAGYALTAEGRALADRTQRMAMVAQDIVQWQAASTGPVPVRISAGTWTARDLAQNLQHFWRPSDLWVPEFVTAERALDIARREVDIGLRNARPTQSWLAGRLVGEVRFAVYAAGPEVLGWIGPADGMFQTPSQAWLLERHAEAIVTRANTPELAAALAQAGVGRVVLPTYAGESLPGLMRVSDEISELTSQQWLIAHQDARHEPPIRAALDALSEYLSGARLRRAQV